MYCNFFGFSDKPFEVTPDPKFLYLSPSDQEIIAALIYGIQERRGFITLIGEAGTGKTTLLNSVLERLPAATKVAFISNTNLTFKQMLLMALIDLGIIKSQKDVSKSEAILYLNEFAISQLARGGNVALIVDEAQNLKQNSLENLRLLSNLETPKHKLVQILLCGQPELEAKLNHPKLRQLAQRIILRRFTKSFNENETYKYIEHRLAIVNYNGNQLFNPKTLKLIWEYSRGIPRKINTLCDNALLVGYALEKKQIEERVVKEATRDLSHHPFAESHDDAFQFAQKKAMLI
jgi:general secretion pathway protein A